MLTRFTATKENETPTVFHYADTETGRNLAQDEKRLHEACGWTTQIDVVLDISAHNPALASTTTGE